MSGKGYERFEWKSSKVEGSTDPLSSRVTRGWWAGNWIGKVYAV